MSVYVCELPLNQVKAVARKTIILWGSEDVLGYSVELLLSTRKDYLDIIRIPNDQGEESLILAVENIRPDVIILYNRDCSSNQNLPMQLMQNQEWIKVIVVNHENNSVDVVSKQKVLIQEDSDLLSIVEGCPRLPCPAVNTNT